MLLLLDLLYALLGGFAGHLSRPALKKHFHGDWLTLVCYAIGFTIVTIFGAGVIRRIPVKDVVTRYIATNFLTGLAVGAGVGLGYLAVPDED